MSLCAKVWLLFLSYLALQPSTRVSAFGPRLSPRRTALRAGLRASTRSNDDGGISTLEDTSTVSQSKIRDHLDAVVCGGGPAGLLSAIMLAQRFPDRQIHVMEAHPTPPLPLNDQELWNSPDALARFYTLGVFGRGKAALEHFGVWESVASVAQELVGNQAWRSNTTRLNDVNATLFEDMGREPIYALSRNKLVSSLYQHILDQYGNSSQIQFHFGQTVTPIEFDFSGNNKNKTSVLLEVTKENSTSKQLLTTDFLIGADGAARTVANRMEEVERQEWHDKSLLNRMTSGRPFSVTRYPDTNPRVYKTIPVQLPPDWRKDIGYSASNSNDKSRSYSIVSLPSNTEGGLCAILLMKQGNYMAQADTDPDELRRVLDQNVPVFSNLVDDRVVAEVAKKPPSTFPFFRYAGPRLHKGDRTVILGDACHSVKPYNGLGVNSAFEDVQILSNVLEDNVKNDQNNNDDDWRSAAQAFSKTRAKDCKAVVNLSRAGDRPGRIGFLSYLIPLLMDAFFHKALPAVFEPPIPGLIHNHHKYRFHQVAVRKRWERLAQVSIMVGTATLATRVGVALVRRLATSLGRKPSTVALGCIVPVMVLALARKLLAATK